VRGWIHVESWCEPPEQIFGYSPWRLVRAGSPVVSKRVLEGRRHADGVVVRLEGVAEREAAAAFTGATIEIDRAQLPPTDPGAFYRVDLLGCRVVNEQDVELGIVDHFVDAPAGVVMVVRGEREHWLPAAAPHLREVDLEQRRIRVDWPADF
jgi:16S rRNA processing protein RimM